MQYLEKHSPPKEWGLTPVSPPVISPLMNARHSSQTQNASPGRVGYFSQPAPVKCLRYSLILCHSFTSKTQRKLSGAIAFNGEEEKKKPKSKQKEQSLKQKTPKIHSR